MRYKYTFADLECHYCLELENEIGGCPHAVCPHITENLEALLCDPAFVYAVAEAEKYDSPHRPTLLLLKAQNAHIYKNDEDYDLEEKPVCGYKPGCPGSIFSGISFLSISAMCIFLLYRDMKKGLNFSVKPCGIRAFLLLFSFKSIYMKVQTAALCLMAAAVKLTFQFYDDILNPVYVILGYTRRAYS